MSAPDLAVLRPAVKWHESAQSEWSSLDERTQTTTKVVVLLAATIIAFHYSLVTLVQSASLDTPLAYLGLVPLLSLALAWVNSTPRAPELPIHDRQLDYCIGIPLVATAIVTETLMPGRIGEMYWVDRLDLLFLPAFVAGATVLLFGVRVAWRQKTAIGFLFLAWPWPYTTILLGALGGFTSLTLLGLSSATKALHLASAVPGNAGLFDVLHGGREIPISVVTACSGIDGMVGFFLIGAAFLGVVSGTMVKKSLWLVTGLAVLWCTNLMRLLFIFWVAKVAGSDVALSDVHPVAGIAMFCVGVALMNALLTPFGLTRKTIIISRRSRSAPNHVPQAVPRVFAVTAILLVAALVISVSDSRLKVFDPVATATGAPTVGSFLADPANPAGWTAAFETEFTMNKPLFGEDSRWFRYLYSPTSPDLSTLHSTLPVTADVIDAGSLSGFDAYGVTACYSFHGYTLRDVATVDLGAGIIGHALSYSSSDLHQDWSIVYWIWPVATGSGTRYERIILYLQNTSHGSVSLSSNTPGAAVLARELRQADPLQRRLLTNRAFLVAFARQVIAGQTHQRDTTLLVNAVQPVQEDESFWGRVESGRHQRSVSPPQSASHSQVFAPGNPQFWTSYFEKHPLGPVDSRVSK